MTRYRYGIGLLIVGVSLLGEAPPKQALPAGIILGDETYPLPIEQKEQIRDLQHQDDQIEIENQKMLLKVEQNHAKQAAMRDSISFIAWTFAQSKHIDVGEHGYELDPGQVKLVPKKKVAK